MLEKFHFLIKLFLKRKSVNQTVKNALNVCDEIAATKLSHLDILNYAYNTKEAKEELGIDDKLINELIEDYVAQVIKAVHQFKSYVDELQELDKKDAEVDFTPIKDLAHKNLGVARNLRIKDAEILLNEIMTSNDLKYLLVCMQALEACSIRLHPKCAYKTLKLIEVKSSFLENH